MNLLEGKSAIVTGGSRGIGRSIALEFARQGASLVLNASRASDALTETAEAIRDMGRGCETVPGSVAEEATARALVRTAVDAFGQLDILVNNAGIVRDKPLVMMSEKEFDEVLDVNLRGVYQCSREAVRQMMKQRHGRIISISSVAALAGRPGQCNYTAAKAGIVGFTKSLAREAGKYNVLANALFVGVMETDMYRRMPAAAKKELRQFIPLQRVGRPEEVAGPCVFLGSDLSTFVTGTTINVSGGSYVLFNFTNSVRLARFPDNFDWATFPDTSWLPRSRSTGCRDRQGPET